jgi:hypothetical protein
VNSRSRATKDGEADVPNDAATRPRPAAAKPRPAPTPRRAAHARIELWPREAAAEVPAAVGRTVLRLPGPDDPAPDHRTMAGICVWAAALGLFGLAIGGRAFTALLAGGTPGWYEPTVIVVGVAGMALTAAAYLAVHHRRLPWALLSAATVPLGANLAATIAVV